MYTMTCNSSGMGVPLVNFTVLKILHFVKILIKFF